MYNGGFGYFISMAIIGVIIAAIIGIAFYVFYSYTLYRLAQRRNMEMPWLAWIPIAQMYVIGKLVKSVKISNFEIPSLEIVLPVAMLAYILLNGIPFLGLIISLAYVILLLLSLYNLYMQYVPENAVVYTILSIFIIPVPFFILKLSNMEPINPV
ncbi:MAG TPA: hypothetical protein VIL05_03625 [Thermoclostridium sp.]